MVTTANFPTSEIHHLLSSLNEMSLPMMTDILSIKCELLQKAHQAGYELTDEEESIIHKAYLRSPKFLHIQQLVQRLCDENHLKYCIGFDGYSFVIELPNSTTINMGGLIKCDISMVYSYRQHRDCSVIYIVPNH